jgi:uncharacterized protein YjcR
MPKTVLTVALIDKIRERNLSGVSIKQLANTYGVSYEQIRRIVRGERWKKVLQMKKDRDAQAASLESKP